MSVKFQHLYAVVLAFLVFSMSALFLNGCGGPMVVSAAEVAPVTEHPRPLHTRAPRAPSRPIDARIFEYLERYERDVLYSIIFDNKEYLLLEFQPTGEYLFVLFKDDVKLHVPKAGKFTEESRYYRFGFAGGVSTLDSVIEDIFIFNDQGFFTGTVDPFEHDSKPYHRGNVFGAYQGVLRIERKIYALSYASLSTDQWEGSFVNYHWLAIKDFSVRVGRLTDYERIFVALIFVITCVVVRLYRFRS